MWKVYWKTELTKYVFVRKDNISHNIDILREKIKIHAWNLVVFFGLNLNRYLYVCVKDLNVSLYVVGKQLYDAKVSMHKFN